MGAEKTYVFVRVCQSARHSRSIFVLFQNCKLKAVRALGGSPAVKMRAGKILPQSRDASSALFQSSAATRRVFSCNTISFSFHRVFVCVRVKSFRIFIMRLRRRMRVYGCVRFLVFLERPTAANRTRMISYPFS